MIEAIRRRFTKKEIAYSNLFTDKRVVVSGDYMYHALSGTVYNVRVTPNGTFHYINGEPGKSIVHEVIKINFKLN